jgi:ubiquinone biosynthesis protein
MKAAKDKNKHKEKPVTATNSFQKDHPTDNPHDAPMASEVIMLALMGILKPHNGRKATLPRMRRRAMKVLKEAKSEGILEDLVRHVVLSTGIESFLPQHYAKYQPVVREGMVFMMSSMPLSRLAPKIVDQLLLPESASFGKRLFTLIKDMPTLQKLGQIICRSPGLEPAFKHELVDLEDNIQTLSYARIRQALFKEIDKHPPNHTIIPERRILAEASVCAVVPARITSGNDKRTSRAVLKIVKPKVKKDMAADLVLLDQLMVFLDSNKANWDLGDFNFSATLAQVGAILANEINLESEQKNLDRMGLHFKNNKTVVIPERLAVSTPGMTAMSRVEGRKITDVADLTKKQRRKLAGALAKTCILRPIQDIREGGLFHGDPHAGNIAYTFLKGSPRLIFYDWGMLGHLDKLERFAMILLTLGVMTGSTNLVFYTADIITKGQLSANPLMRKAIKGIIVEGIQMQGKGTSGMLSAIEYLFEKFTHEGVVFSADLMMYEKAMVTLRGVLSDVDPTFNRDAYMTWAAITSLVDDAVRFRLMKLFMKEAWSLYRHSLVLFFDMQKVVLWFLADLARVSLKIPTVFANTPAPVYSTLNGNYIPFPRSGL